jgi:hypothetical protein
MERWFGALSIAAVAVAVAVVASVYVVQTALRWFGVC